MGEENVPDRDDVQRNIHVNRPGQPCMMINQSVTFTGKEDFGEDILPIKDSACQNNSKSCQSA